MFVKLPDADAAARAALGVSLSAGPGVEVMRPADADAAKAWDLAVLVRGAGPDIVDAEARLRVVLAGHPVAVVKGWTFVVPSP